MRDFTAASHLLTPRPGLLRLPFLSPAPRSPGSPRPPGPRRLRPGQTGEGEPSSRARSIPTPGRDQVEVARLALWPLPWVAAFPTWTVLACARWRRDRCPETTPSGARIYTAVTGHKPLRSGHNPPAAWLGRKGGKREKRKCSGRGGLHGGGGRHQDAPSRARALFLPAWTHVPGQKRRLGTNAPPVPQSQDLGRDIP